MTPPALRSFLWLNFGWDCCDWADARVVAWLRQLAGYPQSALEGRPPRGEVWVLHRSADAIERGEHRENRDDQS